MIRVLLALAVVAVYARVCTFDFVMLDDNQYVRENRHVQQGITGANLLWALTTGTAANWHPLTWFSYFVDYELFELNAGGYHAVNLLFHVLNTLFLFEALLALTRRVNSPVWACAFVAALFGLHPLHVESVAWIAERKDVLSTFFWTLALWGYGRYVERPSLARYALLTGFFALGLMAKPMVVTLPFVLLLLDYWPLQRFPRHEYETTLKRLLIEKAPLVALSVASSIVTIIAQQRGGALSSFSRLPLWLRTCNAAVAYVAYLWKTIWPTSLAIYYPYPANYLNWPKFAGAFAVLLTLSALFLVVFRKKRYAAVGWLWYLGTLMPAIGIIQVGSQAMADRYTYIPLTGLFVLVAFGASDLIRRFRMPRFIPVGVGLAVLAASAAVTAVQVGHWRNSVSVFSHALDVTRDNVLSRTELGLALLEEGNTEAATSHLESAVRMDPRFPVAHLNLGNAYARAGRPEDAATEYRKVLELPPNEATPRAYSGLGMQLNKMGKKEEAREYLLKAIEADPEQTAVQTLLGNSELAKGNIEDAARYISRAIETDPNDPAAQFSMGRVFAAKGDSVGAVQRFRSSLAKNSTDPEVHFSLAEELAKQGLSLDAVKSYQEAIRLKPDFVNAQLNLGNLLASQGRTEDALALYTQALEIEPKNAVAHYNRANVLEMQGKPNEAEAGYRRAFELDPKYADAASNLAGVLAKQGRFEEATDLYRKVLELSPNQVNVYINLATVSAKIGKADMAVQYLEQALEIDPGNQLVRQRLEKLEESAPGTGTVLAQ